MKTIIETNETSLAAISFEEEGEAVQWEDMSRDKQIKIINTLSQFHNLFYKFIKEG